MRSKQDRRMIVTGLTATLILMLGLVTSARAVTDVTADVRIPTKVKTTITLEDSCSNHPGPTIRLEGTVLIGDVSADLIFRNNVKGTHEAILEGVLSGVVVDFGDGIQIPKQPSRTADYYGADCDGTGVAGNPFVWIVLVDKDGETPLADPVFLGRCVQGLVANADFVTLLLGHASGHVDSRGCANSPGPYIRVTGDLLLRGAKAKVILKNNPNPPDPHTAICAAVFDVVSDGFPATICKQPENSNQKSCEYGPGAGGNPLIYIRFRSDSDDTGEIFLGRCNKL